MLKPKAQVTLEYAMIVGILVAALLGMSIYIKRSISGRWRESADAIGFGRQYDPLKTVEPKE